jgi:hypothetical protein
MTGRGDAPVQRDNIAVVNIGDFAISTEVPQDVPNHHAIVVLRLLGLAREVLHFIALSKAG